LRPHAQLSRAPGVARLNNRNRLALVENSLAKGHGGKTKDIPKANPAKIFNGIFPILILIRVFAVQSDSYAAGRAHEFPEPATRSQAYLIVRRDSQCQSPHGFPGCQQCVSHIRSALNISWSCIISDF
jgi:hypothetical protein